MHAVLLFIWRGNVPGDEANRAGVLLCPTIEPCRSIVQRRSHGRDGTGTREIGEATCLALWESTRAEALAMDGKAVFPMRESCLSRWDPVEEWLRRSLGVPASRPVDGSGGVGNAACRAGPFLEATRLFLFLERKTMSKGLQEGGAETIEPI